MDTQSSVPSCVPFFFSCHPHHPAGLPWVSSRGVGDRYSSAMGFGVNWELWGLCSRPWSLQKGVSACNIPGSGREGLCSVLCLSPLGVSPFLSSEQSVARFQLQPGWEVLAVQKQAQPCCGGSCAPVTNMLPKTLSSSLLPEMQTWGLLCGTAGSQSSPCGCKSACQGV